jgi:hypothetical protein
MAASREARTSFRATEPPAMSKLVKAALSVSICRMPRPRWFRPKTSGYGATPTSWQGWVLTIGSALLTSGAIVLAILAELQQWPDRRPWQAICVIIAMLSVAALTIIAHATTDGEWRWRP